MRVTVSCNMSSGNPTFQSRLSWPRKSILQCCTSLIQSLLHRFLHPELQLASLTSNSQEQQLYLVHSKWCSALQFMVHPLQSSNHLLRTLSLWIMLSFYYSCINILFIFRACSKSSKNIRVSTFHHVFNFVAKVTSYNAGLNNSNPRCLQHTIPSHYVHCHFNFTRTNIMFLHVFCYRTQF